MSTHYPVFHQYLIDHVLTPFYGKRLASIQSLKLDTVLKAKNPYLFRAKNIELAGDLIRSVVDAYLSSQEETMFGNLLEGFTIYVASTLYGGRKRNPPLRSVDLEFERDGTYYIVGIKSGTVWGNADQINTMKNNFKAAKIRLRTEEGISVPIIAVNGCMYGKDSHPLKDTINRLSKASQPEEPDRIYYKYAGQDFWTFLSGDDRLYQEIIVPIDEQAQGKDAEFKRYYTSKINELTASFTSRFLTDNKLIDWEKLIDFVSKRSTP